MAVPEPTPGKLESWPCAILHKRLKECKGSKPQCVLVTTGAMNPPHRGHAQLLYQARVRLEKEGYDVLAGWLSPSQDGYVGPKASRMGTVHISGDLRLHMAQLMLHGDDFLSVGAWEAQYDGSWPDFPEVAVALQKQLSGISSSLESKSGKPRVFYACGTDHAERCGLYNGMRNEIGVVVVPREGERPKAESIKNSVFVASPAPGELASFSSTKVREALKKGNREYVSNAVSEIAARFLLEPTEEERDIFRNDFIKFLGV